MHNLRVRLAVIDTGGTTIRDDDVVITACVEALAAYGGGPDVPGFEDRLRFIKLSMGRTRLDQVPGVLIGQRVPMTAA